MSNKKLSPAAARKLQQANERKEQAQQERANAISKADRLMEWSVRIYVLWMFIIHPLILGTEGYYNITAGKLTHFSAVTIIFVVVTLILYLYKRINVPFWHPKSEKWYLAFEWHEWAAIGFLVIMLIAAIFSGHFIASMIGSTARNEGWFVWTGYIAVFLLIGRFYKPKKIDFFLFCTVAALSAIYGMCQYYGHDWLNVLPSGYSDMIGPKLTHVAAMSNIDVFSTYQCLALVSAVVCFTWGDNKSRLDWIFLLFGVISFYSLLLGGVLSGAVGVLAAVAFCFPLVARDREKTAKLLLYIGICSLLVGIKVAALDGAEGWKYWYSGEIDSFLPAFRRAANDLRPLVVPFRYFGIASIALAVIVWFIKKPIPRKIYLIVWYAIVVLVIIAVIIGLPYAAEKTNNGTIREAAGILRGEMPDTFGSYRGYTWKAAWGMFLEHPILGLGPDGFFPEFNDNFGEISYEKFGVTYDKVHNEFLQVLVDGGIFALLAELAMFGLLLFALRKRLDDKFTVLLFTFVVLYIVQAFFNIATPFANPFVWIFLGMTNAQSRRKPEEICTRQ